jgi:hypothetical protein
MAAWEENNQTFIASMLHPYCMEKIARYEKALKHADFIVMDEIRPARRWQFHGHCFLCCEARPTRENGGQEDASGRFSSCDHEIDSFTSRRSSPF